MTSAMTGAVMGAARLALVWIGCGAVSLAADSGRVIFTKSFPGSTPAYIGITLERSGAATYKEAEDDDPDKFQIEGDAAGAIFDLASKLDHFARPVESGLKVANMGLKTFRWENGEERNEVKFNYSTDDNAKALWDWFEAISETERMLAELKRSVKHDKLGVHDALIAIEGQWQHRRLIGAAQFLPLLDQVIANEMYLHMARERAAQLAEAIRGAKGRTQ